jgi:ribosomal-protein-serine acetyltransferase
MAATERRGTWYDIVGPRVGAQAVGQTIPMEITISDEIILRTLQESHAQELFSLVDRNRAHLRAWLPWLDVTRSAADSVSFIRAQTSNAAREEEVPFGIFYRGCLAGVVGYNWIRSETQSCGLGYWLSETLQRRGIVTRAVRALARHAFERMGLRSVEIHVAVDNARSRAVARRLGFRQRGVRAQAEWLYDHHVDHVVYGLDLDEAAKLDVEL